LGWALITHPFHPRRGERFRVIKARRYCQQPTLILEGEGGTFSILEEWTDKAAPVSGDSDRLLSAPALLELVKLGQRLKAGDRAASPLSERC
jgi:hypothetical protein